MRKSLLLSLAFLLAASMAFAQDRTVSGKVTSADDGSAVPGVNVVVRGTTTGTVTDIDGNYKLSVPAESEILVFSFIGLVSHEVEIGSRSTIDVAMASDFTQLGEVIVSGVAGATRREKLTVSVVKVGEEALKIVPATSVSSSLVGKVSGVRVANSGGTPGGDSNIQLRGDTNLGVGSSPMVIVDGVIIEGDLASINVDDIESIEVVKGASASSLYGSRAGNGVIVVTSKRGNNLSVGKTTITLRNEIGFDEIGKKIDLAEHHAFALAPTSGQNTYTEYDGVTYPADYTSGYHPDLAGNRYFDDDHYMDNDFARNIDQQGEFFSKGTSFTNYAGIATRGEKTNLFASFENQSKQGVILNTDGYQRQNFRVNFDHYATDWLKLSASNLFINTFSNSPGGGGTVFFDIVLAEPDNDLNAPNPLDGQPHYIRHNQWSNEENPLYFLYKNQREDRTRRFLLNYRANATITDWVNFEAAYSQETINYFYESYWPKDTWEIGGTDPWGIQYSDGSLYKYQSFRNARTAQGTFNFNKQFGDLIVKAKLSYLWENNRYTWNDAYGFNFVVKDLPNMRNFINANTSVDSYASEIIAQNYFGIVSLDYKDKILLDGMYRLDESSLFGENNRTHGYYRVSAGYRITEDLTIPGFQELKIRAAYGTAGMRPGFDYQYEVYSNTGPGSYAPSQIGNKDLKPSNTAETEVALNMSFLNRFTFEAIYATAKTTDQFLYVPLLAAVNGGADRQWQNAGTVESMNYEFNLGAAILKDGPVTWNLNATFSHIEQTITELTVAPYQTGPDGLYYIKEGETYGSIYGLNWVRSMDDMAKNLDYAGEDPTTISDYQMNSDGYVIEAGTEGTVNEAAVKLLGEDGALSYAKIGDGNPKFMMGIRNTIKWKGLTVYALVDWKNGGDVYNRKSQWLTRDDRNGIMDQSGKPANEKKALDYYKQFYDVNTNNAYWVEDASFVKIREMSIGYSWDKSQLEGLTGNVFQAITIRAIGRNLITFTGYTGYDPEVGSIRAPFDGTGRYPNFRNYALSLTLDF
jgi:TonB-linked SusC/RagA family outer membrane protein